MKIIQINVVFGTGSTGRITADLHQEYLKKGYESYVVYGYGKKHKDKNLFRMQNLVSLKANIGLQRIDGHMGSKSYLSTLKVIKLIKSIKPDVIHLHNIHGYYINIYLLFKFLKTFQGKIFWTFHDMWPITGHCYYDEYHACTKWLNGCGKCPAWNDFLILGKDRSKQNLINKKELFLGLSDLTIIVPSKWLLNKVQNSFLSNYKLRLIYNGIDTSKFNSNLSGVKYFNNSNPVILGIFPDLNGTKGGRYLYEIAIKRPDINFIFLSLKEKIMMKNVLVIKKTNNLTDLITIYRSADLFVNTTLVDNYPTVNIEALACGLPVITFESGGSPEGIKDNYGAIVKRLNLDELNSKINQWIKLGKRETPKSILDEIDRLKMFNNYLNLLKE